MSQPDAKRTTEFMRLLHAFQGVERVAYAPDLVRKENDAEHSYHLAMLAWYLMDSLELPYSKEKVLSYALAHDLHEVYAGDTFIFDQEALQTKNKREREARERIAHEFPEFSDLHRTVAEYERFEDPESKFVYATDKLIPLVTNYLQGGKMWKDMKVSSEVLFAHKREKIADQKEIRDILEQCITELTKDMDSYFNS
jgi:putative hydrolase of HD superfamily